MRITKQQAKEFLDDISGDEKVAIAFHFDLDGYASGILIYDYLKEKGINDVEVFALELKNNALADILEKLKLVDKIIIADMGDNLICDDLYSLEDKSVLVLDHHPKTSEFPREVLEYNDSDSGYFPSSRTCYEIVGGKQWLSVAGVMSDRGHVYSENTEFIDEFLKKESLELIDYKKDFVDLIDYVLIYLRKDFGKIFNLIENLNSWKDVESLKEFYLPVKEEFEFFEKDFEKNKEVFGDILFYYFEPKFKIKVSLAGDISVRNKKNIVVFASPSDEKGFVSLSARNKVEDLTASDVLKIGIEGLDEARSGGHLRASGGIIKGEDIGKFKENLKNYVESNKNL